MAPTSINAVVNPAYRGVTMLLALSVLAIPPVSRAPAFEAALAVEDSRASLARDEPPPALIESSELHLLEESLADPAMQAVAAGSPLSTEPLAAMVGEPATWDAPSRANAERSGDERLIDRVTDPTSWLLEFRFREQWNWPVDGTGPDTQAFEFRPSIPFVAWDHVNLLRASIPYEVDNPAGEGIGTVQIYDLVVFDAHWGRWGVGPLVQFAPPSRTGKDEFQMGPVAGAVTKTTHWTKGLLSQNFFSGNVSQSRIQPIVTYKFNDYFAAGLGETELRYDWHDGQWTQAPLGIEFDYLTDICGQKFKLFANPQYNFFNDSSNSGWTMYCGMSLLAPEKFQR